MGSVNSISDGLSYCYIDIQRTFVIRVIDIVWIERACCLRLFIVRTLNIKDQLFPVLISIVETGCIRPFLPCYIVIYLSCYCVSTQVYFVSYICVQNIQLSVWIKRTSETVIHNQCHCFWYYVCISLNTSKIYYIQPFIIDCHRDVFRCSNLVYCSISVGYNIN